MTPKENLYYALGQLAYAVARSDGRLQNDEVKKFHGILESELGVPADTMSVSDIIFHMMDKDDVDAETAYKNAMDEIRLHSEYFTPHMKLSFLRVIEKIAKAFPPVLRSEKKMIARVRHDLAAITNDSLFFPE